MSLYDKMYVIPGYRDAVCEGCKNFTGIDGKRGMMCKAYPDGIPDKINVYSENVKKMKCSEKYRYEEAE